MAVVKVILEHGESIAETEETLVKAIGEKQDQELFDSRFDDHLMNLLATQMDDEFKSMCVNLVRDVVEVIKSDY